MEVMNRFDVQASNELSQFLFLEIQDEYWYSLGLVQRGQVGCSPVKEADCEAEVKPIRRIDAVFKFLKLQNDWKKLYDVSIAEGWRDEDTLSVLEKSVVFQASRRCYGRKSETYEGGFDEVLLLRQDGIEQLQSVDTGSASVEAILMQHEDFPVDGKLMVAALMWGGA
ncbi:hypothetical protein Cgig2_007133 [Carnegiea gigantea]|uniref:Uncharacterized protein n=1 Tax=Carnegiea gigantea TaxID=171969 RepID=A0A9Q1KLV3_9CARY|nr:hypothetical protein Cgig2_007133 [Carnegiea gigantea]